MSPLRFCTTATIVLSLAACGDGGPSEPDPEGPARLSVEAVGATTAGEPFDVTVTLESSTGAPVPAEAATTINLIVSAGSGALTGNTIGVIAPGASQVTIEDVVYDHARDGGQIGANALGLGLPSQPADLDLDFDFSGEVIAFRRTLDDDEEIYLMTPDGSAFVNITENEAVDSDPSWSPDGSRIAFVSTREGNADLWVMNQDGSGLVQVTDNQGSVRFPSWSPDGTNLVYSASIGDQRDIYRIAAPSPASASGGPAPVFLQADAPEQLTNTEAVDNEPLYTPTGTELLFFSTRSGVGAVWSIDLTGTRAPFDLSVQFVFACAPGIGYSIVASRYRASFVAETDGRTHIWTMDLDGSNIQQVTTEAEDAFYSSWMVSPPASAGAPGPEAQSATQARLVFDSDQSGSWQLYSINEDGSDQVRLTHSDADDQMPRWRAARD